MFPRVVCVLQKVLWDRKIGCVNSYDIVKKIEIPTLQFGFPVPKSNEFDESIHCCTCVYVASSNPIRRIYDTDRRGLVQNYYCST